MSASRRIVEPLMAQKKSNLSDLNVLLGVSGGVAAYKAVYLASKLTAAGARVNTVMTENACRLVGPKSFEAVTNSVVFTSLWDTAEELSEPGHIKLIDWADIIVVAPATANIIGKLANGICDEILSTLLCAGLTRPILLAPATNENMWGNPAVQRNVKAIADMGIELIGPETGRLACGTEGIGRMTEPQDILERIEKIASGIKRRKK